MSCLMILIYLFRLLDRTEGDFGHDILLQIPVPCRCSNVNEEQYIGIASACA